MLGQKGEQRARKQSQVAEQEAARTDFQLAASSAARPADLCQQKRPSARLQGQVEEAGVQRYPGGPGYPRGSTSAARVMLAEVRGPENVQQAPKFDPFKTPSLIVQEFVEVSDASFMPPRNTTLPENLRRKYLSSLPGFHESLETHLARNRVLGNVERDQIVTMQGVAGFCVIAIILATVMFIAYYFSWSIENKEESISTPLFTNDANNENNTLPVFPLYKGHTKVE
ncbi:hypothetical protein MTO96_033522 [Rhipicephalus appendiculatus]